MAMMMIKQMILLREVFEMYFSAIDGRPNTKGGHYRINLLPTTCHVYFGSVIGATPDGRLATETTYLKEFLLRKEQIEMVLLQL